LNKSDLFKFKKNKKDEKHLGRKSRKNKSRKSRKIKAENQKKKRILKKHERETITFTSHTSDI